MRWRASAMAAKISPGAIHDLPRIIENALKTSPSALAAWEDITALARNEWICWIMSAKKEETRKKRLFIAIEQLSSGKRRPCCWPGCPHR